MGKKLGSILVLIVAGALMLYSASRTMHLLSATLPAGQEVLAVIALAAFDLGLVAWLIVFMRGAEGGLQRGIALLMVIVDLCGVIVGFLGDTLLSAGQTGLLAQMAEGDKQTVIMLTAIVIAINIAGTIFYHIADPSNLRRMAEENAKDKITAQSLKAIEQQANLLSAQLAPLIASDWVRTMTADITGSLTSTDTSHLLKEPAKPAQLDSAKPSRLELFKQAFERKPEMATMASDSPTLIEPEAVEPEALDHNGKPFVSAIGKDTIEGTSWENLLGDAMRAGFEAAGLKYEAAQQPAAKKGRPKKS